MIQLHLKSINRLLKIVGLVLVACVDEKRKNKPISFHIESIQSFKKRCAAPPAWPKRCAKSRCSSKRR